MNIAIATAVRLLFVVAAGISLTPATAQQNTAQQVGVISTPGGQTIPVFGKGQMPMFGYVSHSRNVRPGSTPASRAAEAAATAAASKKWQADIAHGEALMKVGDLSGAEDAFQQMIASEPVDGLAYRRLAEAYVADGKLPEASQAFHKFLVEGFGPGTNGGVVDDASEWAEYALVLAKTNQPAEAVQMYNHAAYLLDYEDSDSHGGQPTLKVLLPEVAMRPTSPEQVAYTPEHLQALADTALAHEEMGLEHGKEAMAHMKEAVTLYPTSAVTHYYLGEAFPSRTPEQKAAYQKAAELGDERTAAAAKERLAVLR
jgi:tetratricopeptide (TPR) repeat protein